MSLLSGSEASDKQVCVLSTWDKISDKQAQGEGPKNHPGNVSEYIYLPQCPFTLPFVFTRDKEIYKWRKEASEPSDEK